MFIGLCEVLIWFRDDGFGMVTGRCDRPSTNISQENVLTTIKVKRQFRVRAASYIVTIDFPGG